jgi:hypothetical protein
MPSLYDAGWRLGSIFAATLPFDAVVLDAAGAIVRLQREHGRWAVATQECDLDLTECQAPEPTIEVRAVHTDDPPDEWGVRSSRFRLNESDYVISHEPRISVSAAVLTSLRASGAPLTPDPARSRAFAIWLGLRYDRPALPPHLVELGKRIAHEVSRKSGRVTAAKVRDVLMQFDDAVTLPRFSLFAVLADPADEEPVREWLAGVATNVPAELGLADELLAAPADLISLRLIEDSYAADATQLTWRPNDPQPVGAE